MRARKHIYNIYITSKTSATLRKSERLSTIMIKEHIHVSKHLLISRINQIKHKLYDLNTKICIQKKNKLYL